MRSRVSFRPEARWAGRSGEIWLRTSRRLIHGQMSRLRWRSARHDRPPKNVFESVSVTAGPRRVQGNPRYLMPRACACPSRRGDATPKGTSAPVTFLGATNQAEASDRHGYRHFGHATNCTPGLCVIQALRLRCGLCLGRGGLRQVGDNLVIDPRGGCLRTRVNGHFRRFFGKRGKIDLDLPVV
jgi:hypothetical protein